MESSWQLYELHMARMEGIEARRTLRFVHLILMPEVCTSKYPRTVRDFIRKDYYTEYPDDQMGNAVFWEKLKIEIQKDLLSCSLKWEKKGNWMIGCLFLTKNLENLWSSTKFSFLSRKPLSYVELTGFFFGMKSNHFILKRWNILHVIQFHFVTVNYDIIQRKWHLKVILHVKCCAPTFGCLSNVLFW